MKQVDVAKKRNIVFVGHHGSGKTSLIEAILYHTGAIERLGRIDDGNTFSDYLEEEKDKKITISTKLLHCSYKGYEINIIDTPGYSDFLGDIKGAIHAVDGAVVVINAQSGVEVETEKLWDYLNEYNIPRIVVVNKMDKEHADYDKCLSSLEAILNASVCPVRLPYISSEKFQGVIDLVSDKLMVFDAKGGIQKNEDIPADLHDQMEDYRKKMLERAVETDDAMMERYFADEEITMDEIRSGLKNGAMSGDIVPVLVTDAYNCIGIQTFLDGIINYLPDPSQRKTYDSILQGSDTIEKEEIKEDGPGIGFVYKSFIDPFAGKMSLIRVFSGAFKGEMEWHNISTGNKERVGHLLSLNGKAHTSMSSASVGDIVAVAKVDGFDTNHTVSMTAGKKLIPPTSYPQPTVFMALHCPDKNEEDKLGTLVPKYITGDKTITFERDHETKQNVVSAAGQMQIDLLAQRLKKQNKLSVELLTPKVAYRETVTKKGEGRYRHKKQSGGRGQFGEVQFRIKPLERGKQYEFVNNIFGGSVPSKFIPAVEKGIALAMEEGFLAGFPVVDIQVEIFDGSYHEVDSSEMAFKIAASKCFKEVSKSQCAPILLEPIMSVKVLIPDEYMGDVMGDLNSRRGRVLGMDPADGRQIIKAHVPLAEMYSYSIDLRSITRGRGGFEMEFSHYDPVPHEITEKIVADANLQSDDD
jgi:elongation factor G